MNAPGNQQHSQRRISSYIYYAFSSILFDVIAYSMSGKFYSFLAGHKMLFFFFPTLVISWTNTYLKLYGYAPYALTVYSGLLLGLPIITFLAGLFVHRLSERRRNADAGNEKNKPSSQ